MIHVEWRRDEELARTECWDMYVDDEFEGWVLRVPRTGTPLVRELRAGLERGAA